MYFNSCAENVFSLSPMTFFLYSCMNFFFPEFFISSWMGSASELEWIIILLEQSLFKRYFFCAKLLKSLFSLTFHCMRFLCDIEVNIKCGSIKYT